MYIHLLVWTCPKSYSLISGSELCHCLGSSKKKLFLWGMIQGAWLHGNKARGSCPRWEQRVIWIGLPENRQGTLLPVLTGPTESLLWPVCWLASPPSIIQRPGLPFSVYCQIGWQSIWCMSSTVTPIYKLSLFIFSAYVVSLYMKIDKCFRCIL